MTYLVIAYSLIAVVLIGYGASVWQRLRAVEDEIRGLEMEMIGWMVEQKHSHVRGA